MIGSEQEGKQKQIARVGGGGNSADSVGKRGRLGSRETWDVTFLTINEKETWSLLRRGSGATLDSSKSSREYFPVASTERKRTHAGQRRHGRYIRQNPILNVKTQTMCSCPCVRLTRLAALPPLWPCPSPCLCTAPRRSASSGPLHQLGTIRHGRVRLGGERVEDLAHSCCLQTGISCLLGYK